jgi:hypothetical protein
MTKAVTLEKSFNSDELENERMLTFLMAKEHVRVHNEAYRKGKTSFEIEVNHIADLVRKY